MRTRAYLKSSISLNQITTPTTKFNEYLIVTIRASLWIEFLFNSRHYFLLTKRLSIADTLNKNVENDKKSKSSAPSTYV